MRGFRWVAACAVLAACGAPSRAQALLHRYSFKGNAYDSVGGAHGVVVGSVTFQYDPNAVNGNAVLAGGTSASSPGYIRLPAEAVSGLQNATIEIFTTSFDMPKDQAGQPGGQFQTLFALGGDYGNQANYAVLAANRGGAGIGIGARRNSVTERVITSRDPLPVWRQNHVVDLVFAGFAGIGTSGTVTIYLDGDKVAEGASAFSLASVAGGTGGVTTAGLGGGSPFNDPTFRGSMCEARIFGGALTQEQVRANVLAGPAVLGFTPAVAPYALEEAVHALRIAAGIDASSAGGDVARLNLEPGTLWPSVELADALRLARKASGTDANP